MSGQQRCEHCGATAVLVAVPVHSRDSREHRTLRLCSRCLGKDESVWRLRWVPERESVAA
jgi:hypothetical protein